MIEDIIQTCMRIDEIAVQIYSRLASESVDPSLTQFWSERKAEERRHVAFWREMQDFAQKGLIPEVFDAPGEVLKSLETNMARVEEIATDLTPVTEPSHAFLIGYRLEFYLLHPAFEGLFHYARILEPHGLMESPEKEYEEHVDAFVDGMRRWGAASLELETIGEVLQNLWRQNRRLTMEATSDPLTGLFNRRGFLDVVHPLVHLSKRSGQTVGILVVDVDRFKAVNDKEGHARGDAVLVALATRLQDVLRGSDIVGRWGGEEFVVFLYPVEPAAVQATAEKLRRAVASAPLDGLDITVSIGAAQGVLKGDPAKELDHLWSRADQLLFEAKAAGRNAVRSD